MPQIEVRLSRDENINKYDNEIVILDLEEYVKGVVPSEMGNSALEACKAQAVAARTFALSKKVRQGFITDKSNVDQAFRASRISSLYSNALQAVEETCGEVLYYNNKLIDGCVYSASNGGHVYSATEVWGSSRAYLISKDDPYDTHKKNGHGIGMSQAGAKEMAKLGFSYIDILDFYYPGTEIKNNYGEVLVVATNAEKVIKYAESKIGCGYIWGTSGQVCTQALINQQMAQYPDNVNPDIVSKWIGKEVFDCAGFVRKCMAQANISMVSGATSQWNKTKWLKKGTIDTLPQNKVCCLYREKDNKMQHTGVYLGNGYFIDARGSATGVIKSKLGSYSWTHWGIPVGLYDSMDDKNTEVIKVLYKAKVIASSGSTVNMRAEPSTQSDRIAKVAVGQEVEVLEETNAEWAKILWNNKTGYMMKMYLQKDSNAVKEEEWYVRIKCKNKSEAESIAKLLGTATVAS